MCRRSRRCSARPLLLDEEARSLYDKESKKNAELFKEGVEPPPVQGQEGDEQNEENKVEQPPAVAP